MSQATLSEFKAVLVKHGREIGRYFDVVAAKNLHALYVAGQTSPVLDRLIVNYGSELQATAAARKHVIAMVANKTPPKTLKGKLNLDRKLKIIDMVSSGTNEVKPIAIKLGLAPSHAAWYLRELVQTGVLDVVKCDMAQSIVKKNVYSVTGKPLGDQALSAAELLHLQRSKEVIELINAGINTTGDLATSLNLSPAHTRLFLNKMADCGELVITKHIKTGGRTRGAGKINIYVLPSREVAA